MPSAFEKHLKGKDAERRKLAKYLLEHRKKMDKIQKKLDKQQNTQHHVVTTASNKKPDAPTLENTPDKQQNTPHHVVTAAAPDENSVAPTSQVDLSGMSLIDFIKHEDLTSVDKYALVVLIARTIQDPSIFTEKYPQTLTLHFPLEKHGSDHGVSIKCFESDMFRSILKAMQIKSREGKRIAVVYPDYYTTYASVLLACYLKLEYNIHDKTHLQELVKRHTSFDLNDDATALQFTQEFK